MVNATKKIILKYAWTIYVHLSKHVILKPESKIRNESKNKVLKIREKKNYWKFDKYWVVFHFEFKAGNYLLISRPFAPKLQQKLSSLSEFNNTNRMFKGIEIKYVKRMSNIAV